MRTLTFVSTRGTKKTVTVAGTRRRPRHGFRRPTAVVSDLLDAFDARMRARFDAGFTRIAEARNDGMTHADVLRECEITSR